MFRLIFPFPCLLCNSFLVMHRHSFPHTTSHRQSYAHVLRQPPNSHYTLRNRTVSIPSLVPQTSNPNHAPPLGHPPDDATRQTAKVYFKIIQAVHHGGVTEKALQTGCFPVGMMRQVDKLTNFIKPASPTESTTNKVRDNTHSWMKHNMDILQTHYTHTIDTLIQSPQPHNPDAYTIALGWARKRYTHKLTIQTLTRVEDILKPQTRNQQTHTTQHTQHTTAAHTQTRAYTHAHTLAPHHTLTTINTQQPPPLQSHFRPPGHGRGTPATLARPGLLPTPPHPPVSRSTSSIPPLLGIPVQPPNSTVPRPPVQTTIVPPRTTPSYSRSLSLGERPAAFALPPRPPRHGDRNSRPTQNTGPPRLPSVTEETVEDSVPPPPSSPPSVQAHMSPVPPSASSTPRAVQNIGTSPLSPLSFNKRDLATGSSMEESCLPGPLDSTSISPPHTPSTPIVSSHSDARTPAKILQRWQHVKSTSLSPIGGAHAGSGNRAARVMMSRLNNSHTHDATKASTEPNTSPPLQPVPEPCTEGASYIPPTPPPITSVCRPVHHQARPGRKLADWTLDIRERALILGDSNVNRFPTTNYQQIQMDSYPGATFHHFQKMLEKCEVHPRVETVVLSVGINCMDNDAFQTSFPQISDMYKEAKTTFPNADIYIPLLNFSKFLSATQKTNLTLMNSHIAKHFRHLTIIHPNQFHTTRDNVHWTVPTANMILEHWARQLHFL